MRIVHISTFDNLGGASRAAYRLHAGLRRAGHDSTMLVRHRKLSDPTVVELQSDRRILSRLRRRWRAPSINRDLERCKTGQRPGGDPFSLDRSLAGAEMIQQIPPCDLVTLHWISGLLDYGRFFPAVTRKAPVVWRMADMHPFTGGCHYDHFCGRFTDRCGACPQLGSNNENDLSREIWNRKKTAFDRIRPERLHIAAPSRWVAGEARRSSLMSRFDVTVIPNGLDIERFAPRDRRAAREAWGIPQDANVILFGSVSIDSIRKGFSLLVEALKNLDEVRNPLLLSIGEGKPELDMPIPSLHLGSINDDLKLSEIYSAADVYVIPSRQESFGQTVTESLACGTPVVGFAVGGIQDTVRPGVTGYLARREDTADLRDCIVRLLNDPRKREEMSAQARRIVIEEYSLDAQAKGYLSLYERILSKA